MGVLKKRFSIMRRIFIVLVLSIFTKSMGQNVPSYTYLFSQTFYQDAYYVNYEWYSYDEYLYNPSNSSFINLTGPDKLFINSPRNTFVNYNVPVDLNTNTYGFSLWGYRSLGSELDDFGNSIPINELIKGNVYKHRNGEAYSVLTPNDLSISNLGTAEVCAGEMLNLAATPAGFHNYVYHWQYSLDGQLTWNDVPEKILNGHNMTNTETTRFAIYDLLGEDHKNHFGPIHFRIGYNQDRMLSTNTIQINYSSCAPVITDVKYQGPNCNGDAVKSIDVYFNRDLVSGESFSLFQIVDFPKVSGGAIRFSQPEIKNLIYDPIKKEYKYSFIIPTSNNTLENNKKYIVDYQASLNGVPKGTMPDAKPFLYQDPEPLTFSITPTDPLCHNDEGNITLKVKGGSGVYSYSLDDGTPIQFTVTTVETSTTIENDINTTDDDITTISRSASQPITLPVTDAKKSYKIKVTDQYGCIEKTL